MKKLDWYILRKFVATFLFAVVVLAVVVACVIDLSEKMDHFVKNHVPLLEILGYYKDFVPHISALLYPLFIFLSCIFFTSQLANKSEIIAMLSTGMSFNRFLWPYIMGGILLGGVSMAANHYIVPIANKDRLRFEDKYVHEQIVSADKNVHMQLSADLLVYIQSYDYVSNNGYHFTAERVHGTELKEKVMADRVSYDSAKKIWKLYNVVIRRNLGPLREEVKILNELDQKYPLTPKDLREDEDIKEALTTPQLNAFIAKQQLHGNENLNFYFVERDRRSAQPFAGLILTIIGACIASRRIRGGSGLHLALGVALCALYMLALQFSTTFSTKAGLNPLLAVWIPNILFSGLAVYLYRRETR